MLAVDFLRVHFGFDLVDPAEVFVFGIGMVENVIFSVV